MGKLPHEIFLSIGTPCNNDQEEALKELIDVLERHKLRRLRVRLETTGRCIGGVLTDEGSGNEIPEYHHFR